MSHNYDFLKGQKRKNMPNHVFNKLIQVAFYFKNYEKLPKLM